MKIRQLRQVKYQRHRQRIRLDKHWAQIVRHRARHLKVGTIIETCSCEVARVVEIDWEGDDLKYEGLMRGGYGYCSIYNCAPKPLGAAAIARRMKIFEQGGFPAVIRRYHVEDCGMTDKQITDHNETWG